MSRIGLKPIVIPSNVTVAVDDKQASVKGLKGELTISIPNGISIDVAGQEATLKRDNESKELKSLHGLTRSLIANAIIGVTDGYDKKLEVNGVGFKVNQSGADLVLSLGFSHEVKYRIPEDVKASVDQNIITISGIDKQRVGQIAAEIRSLKKPEPYKGKGIKYENEYIIRKAGKAASGGKE